VIRQLSLTTRLTLLFALVSSVVLLGLGWVITSAVKQHFIDQDREKLEGKVLLVRHVVAQVSSHEALEAISNQLRDAFIGHDDLVGLALGPDGEVLFSTPGARVPLQRLRQPIDATTTATLEWSEGERQFMGIVSAIETAIPEAPPIVVAVAIDTDHQARFMTEFSKTLLFFVIGAALISGVLGWLAARSGLAPLGDMKATAAEVTAHRLDHRLPVSSVPVEMADLAVTLNQMLDRLEDAFRRLSEFSSDLAHELRTPICNLMTETQVALSNTRDAEAYRDILSSNAEEFERLARMISDMLFLAKADHGLMLPSRETITLEHEIGELYDFYDAVAEEKDIALQFAGAGKLAGDRLMLRRAISNLLSNALRYTPRGGYVSISISEGSLETSLTVENSGATIEPVHLPHLFDRFFRADKARSHGDSEGTGLGLAITKAIVAAHGGQVAASSSNGVTRFRLTFPGGRSRASSAVSPRAGRRHNTSVRAALDYDVPPRHPTIPP
jgi:two-component system heavy metal sensor histidine kinase CusS